MSEEHVSIPLIEVPKEELPSRGVSYPDGTQISFRTYTFGEVKRFSISQIGIAKSIRMALDGIHVEGMDKMDLVVADALFLGISRKINSLGDEKVAMPYVCGNCKNSDQVIFSLSDVEFDDLHEAVTALPATITVNKKDLDFTPMTVGKFLALETGIYDKILKGGKIDAIAVYAAMCSNIPFEEVYPFLESVSARSDMEALDEIDHYLKCDIKTLKGTCSKCKHLNHVVLEGREALLKPFRGSEDANPTRIRFGKTSVNTNTDGGQDGLHGSDGTTV